MTGAMNKLRAAVEQQTKLGRKIDKLKEQAVSELDLQTTLFRVVIRRPYVGSASNHYLPIEDDVDVTHRELALAIQLAESTSLPDDGTPNYRVVARTDAGDLTVPEEMWIPFSKQTTDTLTTP